MLVHENLDDGHWGASGWKTHLVFSSFWGRGGGKHRTVVEFFPLFLFRLTVVFNLVGRPTPHNSGNSINSVRKE